MLYHEVQEGNLCLVHCVNAVLRGPFFSELDLAALSLGLDSQECLVMQEGCVATSTAAAASSGGDFLCSDSYNVSLGGDFSIQVLQKALESWHVKVIPLDSPVADMEKTFAASQHLSKFCLVAYLYSFRSTNWSKFLARGNFTKEFPFALSKAPHGHELWPSPADAERIVKSCNLAWDGRRIESSPSNPTPCYEIPSHT